MKRLTHDEYIKRLHGSGILPIETYAGSQVKIKHQCLTCLHKWNTLPDSIMRGHGCPECAGNIKLTEAAYKKKLKQLHGGKIKLVGDFLSASQKTAHKCFCGYVWETVPYNILSSNSGCPRCSNCERKTNDTYKDLLVKTHGDKLSVVGEYAGMANKLLHRCNECSHEWEAKPCNIIHRKSGCPHCCLKMKRYKLGKRIVYVQGYEPSAIDWILNNTSVKATEIEVFNKGKVPVVEYNFKKKSHKHKPDLFIPSRNLLCEVKSISTLGLVKCKYNASGKELFYRTCAKAKAAIRAGYKYKLLLMSEAGNRIKLPSNWYEMKYEEIRKCL